MHPIYVSAFAAVCLALACAPATDTPRQSAEPSSADDSPIAAEVNGVPITTAELDAWIKEDLFERAAASPTELYELRESALQSMIAERGLEAAAEQAGVSVERLVADKIAELGPVTDAETADFFEKNKARLGTAEYEELKEQIREFLTSQREAVARDELEQARDVVVHLEPPRIEVAAVGPAKGPADAPITIVEFSDFQCPYCRRVIPTLQQVVERYPGKVRIVYRNFPLGSHARARPAAEAALCANEQDKFWPYHDRLFENSRALGDEDFTRYATELGLDVAAFEQCVKESRFADQVEIDFRDGRAAGVTGTPAFFVNGVLLSGAKPASDFFRAIDAELARLEGDV